MKLENAKFVYTGLQLAMTKYAGGVKMICKRCECSITKKTRRVVVRELHYLRKVKAVYCRHCYKAITGKKRITDCLEMDVIDAGGEINA